jgi:SAM-dependent methyltransferase
VNASPLAPPRGPWAAISTPPVGKWQFWRYNWIAHHKVIRAIERARVHARGRLLDVGCGDMRAEVWFRAQVDSYWGVDLSASRFLQGKKPVAFARAEQLPFRAASFDSALGMSMLTYLPEPIRMLDEACRVLRPGGTLILEFTQAAALHDEPHDYFRFTRYGAAWLLERAGFEVIELIPIGGLWTSIGMSAIAAINRVNRGPLRIVTELPSRLLYIVIQLFCELMDRLFRNPRETVSHLAVARRR